MLKLADNLKLPLDVVTQTIAILAKRRAGKSYTMRRLVEQLVGAKQQVVLVDPKGDQWGVRSSADGKGPGLPLVILGGERADVPLEAGAGEVVAKLVVEEQVSAVLDLSLFRKHEVATFMTGFLENLYRLKAREQFRTPMMLVIDEADAVAPQKPQKGEERMLGAAEDIVRRGGQRGIGCTLVSQRSAVLNKNVLTQAQILVVLRTIAPQDLAAMKAWIEVHGSDEQGAELLGSLPSLPVGDAWFWSPGWPTVDGIFKRVHVLPIETFDSGATPAPGAKRHEPKTVADVDLGALKRQMAATIEKAKADDPRELRRRIVELEKQLKTQIPNPKTQVTSPKVVEKPVVKDAQIARIEKLVERFDTALANAMKQHNGVAEQLQQLVSAVHAVRRAANADVHARGVSSGVTHPRGVSGAAGRPPRPPVSTPGRDAGVHPRASAGDASSNGYLPPGEKATLIAAAQYPAGITREQCSILTGYKRSSRDAYIQRLQGKSYVEIRGGNIVATDAGVAALGADFEPLPTGEDLQRYWLQRLPPGERAILETAIARYPNPVDRDILSEMTSYKRSSRDAYIQRLQARQQLERGGGPVTASSVLFEG
jgi:uncharacterized protein